MKSIPVRSLKLMCPRPSVLLYFSPLTPPRPVSFFSSLLPIFSSINSSIAALISFIKMPKRIILCLDGTWDSADEGSPSIPSNVARLSRMIASEGKTQDGSPIAQVVYYQSGVGTGAMNKLDKIYQGSFSSNPPKSKANHLWNV